MIKFFLVSGALGVFGGLTFVLQVIMLASSMYLYTLLIASFFHKHRFGIGYKPLVSILIPAHNEQDVIAKTLDSVLCQSYKNIEIIVIDDASSDMTPVILHNYQQQFKKIKVLRRELWMERGKPAALNDALKIASGDVIAVFDADAIVKKDFVERVIPHLANRKVAGVQTKVRMYNKNQNLLTMVQDSELAIYGSIIQAGRDVLKGFCGLGGNGQFVKRICLESVGGWETGMLAEDFDLSLVLMERGFRINYVNIPVYQEAVSGLRALLRQRNRWSQGGIQSTLRHLFRVLFHRNIAFRTRMDAVYVFATILQPFILIASFVMTGVTFAQHGFHIPHHIDIYTGIMLVSYIVFIVAGHIASKPEDWKWLPVQVIAYYVYSFMWTFMYLFSIGHYIVKRGRISWAKTQHGVNSENQIPM